MPSGRCCIYNKRVSTVVRRVVLQAVLRPVVEFGSPVWVPAATDLAKLEQVQTAVLRRMVSCSRNVADDVLRVERACVQALCQLVQAEKTGVCVPPAADHAGRAPATPGVTGILAWAQRERL
jgi:hypothetical protein